MQTELMLQRETMKKEFETQLTEVKEDSFKLSAKFNQDLQFRDNQWNEMFEQVRKDNADSM